MGSIFWSPKPSVLLLQQLLVQLQSSEDARVEAETWASEAPQGLEACIDITHIYIYIPYHHYWSPWNPKIRNTSIQWHGSWEEFYESFLSPEYINKRFEEIRQEAKRKKNKAHRLSLIKQLFDMSQWFLFRPQWFLASSTSLQSTSMNPRLFIQETWPWLFSIFMNCIMGTKTNFLAGDFEKQLWLRAALGLRVYLCWPAANKERGSGRYIYNMIHDTDYLEHISLWCAMEIILMILVHVFHHGLQSHMEAALAEINKEHRLNTFDDKEAEEDLFDFNFSIMSEMISKDHPTDRSRWFPIPACCTQDWLETESGLHRGCASYVTMRTRKNAGSRPGSRGLQSFNIFQHDSACSLEAWT